MIILINCQSYLEFFAELRGGAQKKGHAGVDRKGDDLSQKELAVSCFAARAVAKPDFINPMFFHGLGRACF